MRSVGIREFRDKATRLMGSGETLVIEKRGEPIGFFVPICAKDRDEGREALGRLGRTLDDLLDRTGLDEDELVEEITGSPVEH